MSFMLSEKSQDEWSTINQKLNNTNYSSNNTQLKWEGTLAKTGRPSKWTLQKEEDSRGSMEEETTLKEGESERIKTKRR